ncbi:HNH endonuclease signature motif containing protein, partial [Corynebacterium flavescens]
SEQVTAVARRRLREMRVPRTYCERAMLRQHPNGLATLTVTGNGLDMADAFRTIDHKRPGESFIARMLGKADEATTRTRVTTMAVLRLEDYGKLVRRE